MTEFLDLPLDIKTHIFSFLTARDDQISICRTCKDLHGTIVPKMYQSMTLTENLPMNKLSAMLNAENPGVRYIRHIQMVSGRWTKGRPSNRDDLLVSLANQLPRDNLLSFR